MTTLHSELGASKAKRFIGCPGSVNAERGLFSPPSSYAIEGTAAHSLAEKCLRKNVDAALYIGTTITVPVEVSRSEFEDREIEVTEEMAEAVQVYLDEVHKSTGPKRMIEVQFDLSPLDPPEPMFGTSDCADWNPQRCTLHVLDYKHGAGEAVDANENVQLCYYALGAVVALNVKPEKIRITVVQPRCNHPDGPVRSFEFDWEYLAAFKQMLFDAALKTQAPDAPRVVGDHCRFCKAMPTCPAQRKYALQVAQTEFDTDDAPPPAPTSLTLEQISLVLSKAHVVEEWLKSVRAHVATLMANGVTVPGWKQVPKRANRKWKDQDEAVQQLVDLLGPEAPFSNPKFKSPAQIEATLKEANIKFDISPYVEKVSSGTNIVPDTDPRSALPPAPTAQQEFDADEDKKKHATGAARLR